MINYQKTTLKNGLKVLAHHDPDSPLCAVNILYNVGARDEVEEKTGFAHLFEHLMFGGSKNVPKFDEPLQEAGGTNNAFTNPDITNYYDFLPAENIETALWLESDRMAQLNIDSNSLEVQRKVVIEEFKENYINQPYGDIWHKLLNLAYQVHPYKWPTIGKEVKHIEDATLADVKSFFDKHYVPNNAILCIAGGVNPEDAFALAEKWFGWIPKGEDVPKNIPKEPALTENRFLEHKADVPLNAIYKAWHMPDRLDDDYYVCDLVSDVLSNGNSSRLYNALVKGKRLFNSLDAYISGSRDNGLFVVSGYLNEGVEMEVAEAAIMEELEKLAIAGTTEKELTKCKNKVESSLEANQIGLLNVALNLAFYENLGDAEWHKDELNKYLNVTPEQIQEKAKALFQDQFSSTLYYRAK